MAFWSYFSQELFITFFFFWDRGSLCHPGWSKQANNILIHLKMHSELGKAVEHSISFQSKSVHKYLYHSVLALYSLAFWLSLRFKWCDLSSLQPWSPGLKRSSCLSPLSSWEYRHAPPCPANFFVVLCFYFCRIEVFPSFPVWALTSEVKWSACLSFPKW